ncbi:MAG: hypothetical protein NC418_00775 [Muribaculaceae bacterium]|nr:hypothetical protein [Muribaculaceae bacterium]
MPIVSCAIDTDRVLEQVYACCAIDYLARSGDRPEVLGAGQREALRRIACGAAAEIVYSISPAVKATSLLAAPDSPIITLDVDVPDAVQTLSLRPQLELALAASVLAIAYAGADAAMSANYGAMQQRCMEEVKRIVFRTDIPGRIEAA